eukprot:CAMPEP_0195521864 /NCGR_PEP_ID=MMETSP0794_2-20130614/19534_1 /TAXON_ID=515487 /ORGANISM="Stephanopyxis turris, Strain CCMP 815" /LENGTH=205 /DNA_ID=CAMNT_0040651497 /DNA_START=25 /DNA_END=642 /DNA_ORIENTATION=-
MTRRLSFLFVTLSIATIFLHRCTVNAFGVFSLRTTHGSPIQRCVSASGKPEDYDDYDPRDNLGRELRGLQSSGLKKTMEPGDTVVCKREISAMGIYENKSYEIKELYAQIFRDDTQTTEKVPLANLDEGIPAGYSRYITLFNPSYHKEPVVVTPEEVGLVSMRSELVDSLWLAVPGFFWVFVASSFYNTYHERTGGSFGDAFWGR